MGGKSETKTVRTTPEDARRVQDIRSTLPDIETEAAALRRLLLDGLALHEAALVAAGGDLPKGVTLAQLLSVVGPRVMAVLPLLVRHGLISYVSIGSLPAIPSLPAAQAVPSASPRRSIAIDDAAADDVEGMGGGLL
ncbi:MAG TPA: hypothetical protein VFS21_07245 [Roseiflexaceae bacterium]|nr:hypothetical protein [Roseiflexaceae bacterium]